MAALLALSAPRDPADVHLEFLPTVPPGWWSAFLARLDREDRCQVPHRLPAAA